MGKGYVVTVILLVLSFLGTWCLERNMQVFFEYELILLLVGMVLAVCSLAAVPKFARGAWLMLTLLFAAGALNTLVIFFAGNPNGWTILGTLVAEILGFFIALIKFGFAWDDDDMLMTPVELPPAPKPKRKAAKRKAPRRRATKKKRRRRR